MESIHKTSTRKTESSSCARCGGTLPFEERLLVGEVLACKHCDAQLEVVGVEPVLLAPMAKIEEDEEDFTDT